MKINRDKFSKHFARFGLIIMAFVLMIPLCSAATPVSADDGTITLKAGTYRFNDVIESYGISVTDDVYYIQFISNGISFNRFRFLTTNDSYDISFRGDDYDADDLYNSIVGWNQPEFQTVTFATDQDVDDTFGTWYISNTNYNEVNGPSPTDSITNVWTGIMNWITSALNTVQGLFITETFGNTVLPGTYTFNESFDGNFPAFDILGDPSPYMLNYTYNGISFDALIVAYSEFEAGDIVTSINAITFSDFGDSVEQTIYVYRIVDGVVSEENNGYLVDTPVQITVNEAQTVSPLMMQMLSDYTDYDTINADADSGSSYQLTLLGTLAVIGVSISICFLIIGVFQRFLKLRG